MNKRIEEKIDAVNEFLCQDVEEKVDFDVTIQKLEEIFAE